MVHSIWIMFLSEGSLEQAWSGMIWGQVGSRKPGIPVRSLTVPLSPVNPENCSLLTSHTKC